MTTTTTGADVKYPGRRVRNTRRQVIRDLLHDRYHGMIPVTDAMIDAVITGLED